MLQLMVVYFICILSGSVFPWDIVHCRIYRICHQLCSYFAEIHRGGIESKAGDSMKLQKILGYNKVQSIFRIILPQVIKRICRLLQMRSLRWSRILPCVCCGSRRCLPLPSRSQVHRQHMPFVIAAIFYYVSNLDRGCCGCRRLRKA